MLMNVKRLTCVNTTGHALTTMVHMYATVQMVGKDSIVVMVRTHCYDSNAEIHSGDKTMSTLLFLPKKFIEN